MNEDDESPEETKPRERKISLETCLQGQAQLDVEHLGEEEIARFLEARAALDPWSAEFLDLDMIEMASQQEIERRLGIPPDQFASVKASVLSALRDLLLLRRR